MKRPSDTTQTNFHRPAKKGNQTPEPVVLKEGALAVVNVYKPTSKTPKEMVDLLKQQELYKTDTVGRNLKIGYAGRLDPMARGVLLLLVGDENKKKTEYEFFQKTYQFRSVFGFSTDTYDILGMATEFISTNRHTQISEQKIKECLQSFLGVQEQAYPPFSSARVEGKFMFEWAKDGKIDQITPPKKKIEIFSLDILKFDYISMSDLYVYIEKRIVALKGGDFRQDQILLEWRALAEKFPHALLPTVTIKAYVSHGTYIRSISNDLGQTLHSGATVIDLVRTNVSKFDIQDSVVLTKEEGKDT